MDERRTFAVRREHSKGNGNFPDPEPTVTILDRPEDRLAEDLRKERDAELPEPRPNARRSSAAKRAALPPQRSRPRVEATVPKARKSSAKSAERSAVARRAQPGERKTGTAKKASRAKPRRSSR